jgi:hypothetical protein
MHIRKQTNNNDNYISSQNGKLWLYVRHLLQHGFMLLLLGTAPPSDELLCVITAPGLVQ